MKKLTKVILSLAATAAIGAGGIMLNSYIVSYAMEANNDQKIPVITEDKDTKPEAEARTAAVVDGNDKQQTIIFNKSSSSKEQKQLKKKQGKKKQGKGKPTLSKSPSSSFVEGTPSKDDLTEEEAIETAKSAIIEEYALTDETLSKFTVEAKFNVADPKAPIWNLTFYPTNQNDFSEIGTYNITINALSGKVKKILSAADAVG